MGDLQPLIGNPENGKKKPTKLGSVYHPLLYGNNGSLDPGTSENQPAFPLPQPVETLAEEIHASFLKMSNMERRRYVENWSKLNSWE